LGEDVKYTIRGPIVTFWVGHDSYLIRPFVVAGEERDWANYSYIISGSKKGGLRRIRRIR